MALYVQVSELNITPLCVITVIWGRVQFRKLLITYSFPLSYYYFYIGQLKTEDSELKSTQHSPNLI